jgi:lactoylglutathione lyase
MTLEHIAIWTNQLEKLKSFYITFFEGTPNVKYKNPTTGFESYFLTFQSGARLELMQKPGIPENRNDSKEQYQGIIHLAFGVDSMKMVDEKPKHSGKPDFQFSKDREKRETDITNLKPLTRTITGWKSVRVGSIDFLKVNLQREQNI